MAKPVQVREGREPYWRQVVDRGKRSGLAAPHVLSLCRRLDQHVNDDRSDDDRAADNGPT